METTARRSLDGQRVLVGGGCGFFGSYLVPLLVASGAQVTVIDNLENGDVSVLDGVRHRVAFLQQDLRDRHVCDEAVRDIDLFINLAARASGVGFSRTHHGEMLIDNLLCGLVPLQAAARHEVPRVVMTSSSCVYPEDAPIPTPEIDACAGRPETVNEGYGWAKRMQELAAGYISVEHGTRVAVLRPFNLYGGNYRWRSTDRAHVIPALVKRVLDGEDPLVVWGSGQQRRNFLHASDAAEIVVRIIASGAEGPVNIGYEGDTRIADLVALICDVAGRHPTVMFDRSRPDGQARKSADATRLRALTSGYEPRITLRAGIEEMMAWYARSFGGRAATS